jgi:hypothetical protein
MLIHKLEEMSSEQQQKEEVAQIEETVEPSQPEVTEATEESPSRTEVSEDSKEDEKVEVVESAIRPPKNPPTKKELDKIPTFSARNSKIFKAITDFTDQLNDAFGKQDVNVLKVHRIISKTPLTNRKVIDRHLVIFYDFLDHNRDAIIKRAVDEFVDEKIQMTEKIFMNLKEIMKKADSSTLKAIWQHLLNIMYLFNPDDEIIRSELKVAMAEQDTKENKFLMDTFSKFEQAMQSSRPDENTNDPMALMNGLMQSGFLNDMIGNINSGVNTGSLDIKNLIGTVQNLLGNLVETIDKEETGRAGKK